MIQLRTMSPNEFEAFKTRIIPEYARQKSVSGDWDPTCAESKARTEFDLLLPNGLATPHHHLLSIESTGNIVVGSMWVQDRQRGSISTAHLLDIVISEPNRRRGFARQAMLEFEVRARANGLDRISLHVFGQNFAARALYESLGFRTTDLNMAKGLQPKSGA